MQLAAVQHVLTHLGLTKARYHEWTTRAAREGVDALADRSSRPTLGDVSPAEEKDAAIAYGFAPKDGLPAARLHAGLGYSRLHRNGAAPGTATDERRA